MADIIKNGFRGSLDIMFLGENYSLMKPSFDSNLFLMLHRPKNPKSIDKAALVANDSNDGNEVKQMLQGSIEGQLQEKGTSPFDWLERLTVNTLVIYIEPDTNKILLKVGLTVVLADETKEGKTLPGRGFGSIIRLKQVNAEFVRDYSQKPRIPIALKQVLGEYLDAVREDVKMKTEIAPYLAIGAKLEKGEDLTEADKKQLVELDEEAKKAAAELKGAREEAAAAKLRAAQAEQTLETVTKEAEKGAALSQALSEIPES